MNCVLVNYSKPSSIWADHCNEAVMATKHHKFLHFQIYDYDEACTEHNLYVPTLLKKKGISVTYMF